VKIIAFYFAEHFALQNVQQNRRQLWLGRGKKRRWFTESRKREKGALLLYF